MTTIQMMILIFIVFAISRVILKFKKKETTYQLFFLWMIFWLLVAFSTIFPEWLSFISNKIGVGRGVDVAIYVAILALFYLVFRLFVKFEKVDRQLSEIVRKISLTNAQKQYKEEEK
jgi:hypothetical protein